MTGANDAALLVALYETMRRIRSFEERVGEMFLQGATAGSMLHLSIGEEGVAGVCRAMRDGDSFTTHHRGHGVFLARGGRPAAMFAEIGGKASGYCGGKGGSMHIADAAVGHLGANAIVGGGVAHAVGAALSYRTQGLDRVSVAFFGDGAMQQGVLYEVMNMAALWRLPVLFCCINNQYGMGTRIDRAAASLDFGARARAFGLAAAEADGADALAAFAAAEPLIEGARAGRPAFLAVECYRFHGHARMDKSPYRDAEEEAEGRRRDPLARARERLEALGLGERAATLDAAAAAEMDAAMAEAIAAPAPGPAAMFADVYAPGEPAPRPLRAHLAAALAEDRA